MLLAATQYPIKTQKIFPSPPLLRQQHSVKARVKNLRDAWHPVTLTPTLRLHQQAASQPLPLTSRRISHEQGFAYHTAPPAHSRRSAHFLKPLPIAALAALLAAPQAWAIQDANQTSPGVWEGTPPTPVTVEPADNVNLVMGGYLTTGDVAKGTVIMTGGVVAMVLAGGITNAGNATENKVFIHDGKANVVVGGNTSASGNATLNEVTISGGEVIFVDGGFAYGGDATGNTVTLISGKVTASVFGGNSGDCSTYDCVTDNILAVQGKDFQVGGDVLNFDTLNFTLPADIAPNDAMLKVGEDATFPKSGSTDPTTVTIAMADGAKLKAGESVTLIEANTSLGTYKLEITPASTTVKTADGYEFELTTEGTPATKLVATVTKEPPPPPTPDPTPTPVPYYYSDDSSPTMGELGLLLSGIALAGAAAPALRRREKQGKKADTRQ